MDWQQAGREIQLPPFFISFALRIQSIEAFQIHTPSGDHTIHRKAGERRHRALSK